MKKFLILLLLFFIPEVKAQETWVKVGQSMFYGIPGSLAYEMCTKDNFCGMGYFIDVRSLVERGNFRYFNLDFDFSSYYGWHNLLYGLDEFRTLRFLLNSSLKTDPSLLQ